MRRTCNPVIRQYFLTGWQLTTAEHKLAKAAPVTQCGVETVAAHVDLVFDQGVPDAILLHAVTAPHAAFQVLGNGHARGVFQHAAHQPGAAGVIGPDFARLDPGFAFDRFDQVEHAVVWRRLGLTLGHMGKIGVR
ncbi:hypothetical protein D3C80_1086570 [compost metagenome]